MRGTRSEEWSHGERQKRNVTSPSLRNPPRKGHPQKERGGKIKPAPPAVAQSALLHIRSEIRTGKRVVPTQVCGEPTHIKDLLRHLINSQ